MRKIILLIFIAFGINAKSQIVFEHTYDSAATYNFCSGNVSQLLMVNFEVMGEHYVKINRCGKHIKLYALNHSLVKTISLTNLPLDASNVVGGILYLSQKLFNSDSKIEFMYVLTSPSYSTIIYDENQNVLFSEPGCPLVIPYYHMQQYPIYNTSAGTKMILSYTNGQAKVFGLSGTLTTAIQKANGELSNIDGFGVSNPLPNPAFYETKIEYVLPNGVNEADIVLYDLQGKEIKRYKVDSEFSSLLISTYEISAGTYFYQLQAHGQYSGAKKMIVIK